VLVFTLDVPSEFVVVVVVVVDPSPLFVVVVSVVLVPVVAPLALDDVADTCDVDELVAGTQVTTPFTVPLPIPFFTQPASVSLAGDVDSEGMQAFAVFVNGPAAKHPDCPEEPPGVPTQTLDDPCTTQPSEHALPVLDGNTLPESPPALVPTAPQSPLTVGRHLPSPPAR
jgi:hypothetical protein